MNEESRIEALEHELKILKNEIHSTLLEIREQILNHYYPELRAEEPLRSLSLPVRPTPVRQRGPAKPNGKPVQSNTDRISEIAAKGQVQPFSDVFLDDLAVDDIDLDDDDLSAVSQDVETADESDDKVDNDLDEIKFTPPARVNIGGAPQTREVNFRQLKQAATAPKANPAAEKVAPQGKATHRQNFASLAAWVGDSVEKVGKERTVQAVETYATSGGSLSAEMKSTLLRLISLSSDVEPVAPVGTQEMFALMVELDQIVGEQ